MTSFDDWRQEATVERTPVEVCFDRQALSDLHTTLQRFADLRDVAKGKLDQPAELEQAAEQVKQLDAKVAASTQTMWFSKVPLHRWVDLEAEHPATDEQKEDNPKAKVNLDTFEPEMVAMCCDEPGLTVDEAEWLRDFLPFAVWQELVGAARQVNVVGSKIPKGVTGIADRLITELKSITPVPEGSHSPSSEDG